MYLVKSTFCLDSNRSDSEGKIKAAYLLDFLNNKALGRFHDEIVGVLLAQLFLSKWSLSHNDSNAWGGVEVHF